MDVLALRKVCLLLTVICSVLSLLTLALFRSVATVQSSGEIAGEVCLNGHPQESLSFRRCTGYVEQVSFITGAILVWPLQTCSYAFSSFVVRRATAGINSS